MVFTMNMKTLRTFTMGLAAVALLSLTSARASLISVGDPVTIGSWLQGFNEAGVGNFTQVETIFRSGLGGPFEAPGYNRLAAGWSVGLFNANHVVALGSALNNMTWNILFLGERSAPLVFDFYAWNGNELAESARASWSGSSWTITNDAEYLSAPTSVIPEATTMVAGALLLLPLGASTIRILRRKRAA
jgi:hypothetical protein